MVNEVRGVALVCHLQPASAKISWTSRRVMALFSSVVRTYLLLREIIYLYPPRWVTCLLT
jgi:hypothetical protein